MQYKDSFYKSYTFKWLGSIIRRGFVKWKTNKNPIFYLFLENLALKKLAYQRFQYRGLEGTLTDARNAVDGLKSNLSVWAGQCAISDVGKHEAFWLVDLSSTYSIHHITIYYRTENVLWGKGISCIYYKQFAQLKVSKFQNIKIYLRNFHKKYFVNLNAL